jgi:hypothetical protein
MEHADWVAQTPNGDGVVELIEEFTKLGYW